MMSNILKNSSVIIGFVFILSSIYLVEYFLPGTILTEAKNEFNNWSLILSSWAMAFGFVNLVYRKSLQTIRSKGKVWYSGWTVAIMVITAFLGIAFGTNSDSYQYIYQNIYSPISASLMSFAFIYLVATAIRMFRVRSVNETLLLLAAVLAMAGNVQLFSTYTTTFVTIKEWLLSVPGRAGFTAFNIGVAMGVVLMALRTMVGIERGWLGKVEEEE